jgi:hypothetical protein
MEKQKKLCSEKKWFLLVNFRTVAKFFFEEIGKIRFKSVNSGKKLLNKWKFLTKFTNHKIEKKKKKKKK